MIILASKSAARAELLRRAGVEFEVRSSGVDEGPLKAAWLTQGATPAEVAERLAHAKAEAVVEDGRTWVVGADQTLEFEGRLLDKAETPAEARERLWTFRSRTHHLHSAVVLTNGEDHWSTLSTATLVGRSFSETWLDGYVQRAGSALTETVGGYALEGEGVQLFSRVEGDYFAILGLPLLEVLTAMRGFGLSAQ